MSPMTTKFAKQVYLEVYSNEINQPGASHVNTWGSRDKIKTLYLLYQSAYVHQIW